MTTTDVTTTTTVSVRTPSQELVATLRTDTFKEQVALALPANVKPERFVRATITAVMQNPEVITADRESLFQSVIRCAQDGLMPDGREAALVIFTEKGVRKAQYLPMIGGYRKIAAKHGMVLVADIVRTGDEFDWSKVPPMLQHKPALGDTRGEPTHAYAVAFDRDWRFVAAPVVMDIPEIEKVRAVSKAAKSEYGPWVKWWERMAAKTAARRLFNELPLGDLEETDARIVEQADIDTDLPKLNGNTMTVAEADIVAPLANTTPPPDTGPSADAPANPDQYGKLLALVVDLTAYDSDVNWNDAAADYAVTTFDKQVLELSEPELDELLAHLEAQLPAKAKRGRST